MTSAATITIVMGLTSSLEAGIKRHAAVDEQRCALDIVGLIARQPDSGTPDFLGFANPLVRNQFEQFVVMLRRIPGLHINRCPDRAWRDRIHTDAIGRDL